MDRHDKLEPRRSGPAPRGAAAVSNPALRQPGTQPAPAITEEPIAVARRPARGRLVALDAFRGITIAAMILVNSPGGSHHVYALLQHAKWNGWHPADLIFPAFLVIAGMAIPLSVARQVELGADRRALRKKILTRTRIIFGLGLLLNALPYFDWGILRIPGVLQRIALCYGTAALLAITLGIGAQALTAALLLLAYWALLTWVPVPGHGPGVLLPGIDLGAYLDSAVMGRHLLHETWDPEGLLSTLPAIATTLAGVLAGHWLRAAPSARRCVAGLALGGIGAIAIGELWNLWLPINKSLWTSSYAVFTAGTALVGIAFCYWLIDLRGYRRWATPFIIYGTNAILAYYLSTLLTKLLALIHVAGAGGHPTTLQLYLFDRLFEPLASPPMALLYRRGIFVKI
jgi:predicted acyltransferase